MPIPRALIEAAAAGAPIIASDNAGCRDTVVEGRSGFVCPLHAPERLAMGREGRHLAVARFDRNELIDATVAVYEEQLRHATR